MARLLGNLCTGTDKDVQVLIDLGLIECIHTAWTHADFALKQELLWTVSNLAAGTNTQLTALLHSPLSRCIAEAVASLAFDVQRTAGLCLHTVAELGQEQHWEYLLQADVLVGLAAGLQQSRDSEFLYNCLGFLEKLLESERLHTTAVNELLRLDGFDCIESMVYHCHPGVSQTAMRILSTLEPLSTVELEPVSGLPFLV